MNAGARLHRIHDGLAAQTIVGGASVETANAALVSGGVANLPAPGYFETAGKPRSISMFMSWPLRMLVFDASNHVLWRN